MNEEEIRQTLEHLTTYSARLNEVTDAAAATVNRVEKFLRDRCSIGSMAFVERDDSDDAGADEPCIPAIGYDRADGQYRIVAQIRKPDDARQCKPWVNCDRKTKLITFPMLPGLLRFIARQGLDLCNEAEQTEQIVARLTNALDSE